MQQAWQHQLLQLTSSVCLQMDAAQQPGGTRQLAEQLDTIRQLQALVGGQAEGVAPSAHPSSPRRGKQGAVCSAATSAMQANLLLQAEVSLGHDSDLDAAGCSCRCKPS